MRGDDLPLVHGVRVRVHGVRVRVHGVRVRTSWWFVWSASWFRVHDFRDGMDGEVDDFRGSTAALEWRRGLGWVGEEELGGANEAAGGDKQGVILSGFRPDLPPSR